MSSCPRRRALLSQRAAQAAQRLALEKAGRFAIVLLFLIDRRVWPKLSDHAHSFWEIVRCSSD
jgi:hypothetical protein